MNIRRFCLFFHLGKKNEQKYNVSISKIPAKTIYIGLFTLQLHFSLVITGISDIICDYYLNNSYFLVWFALSTSAFGILFIKLFKDIKKHIDQKFKKTIGIFTISFQYICFCF